MRYWISIISLNGLLYLGLKFYAPFAFLTPFHFIVALLLVDVARFITGREKKPEVTPAELPFMFFRTGSVCIALAILSFIYDDKIEAFFFEHPTENENIIEIAKIIYYGLLLIGSGMFIIGYELRQRTSGGKQK